MLSTIVKAPAKINLYLDVINKRPDGYHNLQTIFERIDLCDWIKISVIPKGIKLICKDNIPTDSRNTAYKAAKILSCEYNLKYGFKIEIDKRIPHGAGLGGGSSDAASVLLGINHLLNLKVKPQKLLKLGTKIGADVPFFVSRYSRAFAQGIGDILTPLKQTQKLYFLVVIPSFKILTTNIYNRLHLYLTKKTHNASILCRNLNDLTALEIKRILYNKLEDVILPSYPAMRNIKKALKQAGAEGIAISGSGSAAYGIFKSRKEAARAKSKLTRKNWQLFLARSF